MILALHKQQITHSASSCLHSRPTPSALQPISNLRPFFFLMNSAPEKTSTSSSQQSHLAFVPPGEVVIRTFGGGGISIPIQGARRERIRFHVSGGFRGHKRTTRGYRICETRTLDRLRGGELQTLSRVCRGSADNTERSNFLRLDRKSTRLNSSHVLRSRMPSSA